MKVPEIEIDYKKNKERSVKSNNTLQKKFNENI